MMMHRIDSAVERTVILPALVLWMSVFTASAGPVSRMNSADGIAVDGDRSGWEALKPYPADRTGEDGIGPFDVDYRRVTVADDPLTGTLLIRFETHVGADFGSYPAFYNIFLDTDRSRSTGYVGSGDQFPIGADYLIQGATLFAFTGSNPLVFGWNPVETLPFDNSFQNKDIVVAVPLTLLGEPEVIHFLLYGDNVLNGNTPDYYPDEADQGEGGEAFEYRPASTPEEL